MGLFQGDLSTRIHTGFEPASLRKIKFSSVYMMINNVVWMFNYQLKYLIKSKNN